MGTPAPLLDHGRYRKRTDLRAFQGQTMEQATKPGGALDASTHTPSETPAQRVRRLYKHPAGPLVAWLLEDAVLRKNNAVHLAARLRVTAVEFNLLARGDAPDLLRDPDVLRRAAAYLGIPPITARLLAGDITARDFGTRVEPEDEVVEREFARFMSVPRLRALVPDNGDAWTLEDKRILLDIHGESRALEWPGLPRLPDILRWLQRAAVQHDENEARALREMS